MKNKALVESAAKTLFGLVPYGGPILNEVFFDYRSRVKQERLNVFIEELLKYLESNNLKSIPAEIQQSEDFGDLFESIVKRVIQTNYEEKMNRFRNVVIDYLSNPIKLDYSDTYLDIIDRINEIQIKILKAHALIKDNMRTLLKLQKGLKEEMYKLNDKLEYEKSLLSDGKANNYYDLTSSILALNNQLKKTNQEIKIDDQIRHADYYGLTEGDYLFLVQDLYAKGLLIDIGIGGIDTKSFENMAITSFGKGFLNFINEKNTDELELQLRE
jgi:hypothetical protein